MARRILFTACLSVLALPSFSTLNRTEGFLPVQQDLVNQIEVAQQDLREGEPMMAMAHADLVLINHTLKVYVNYEDVPQRQVPTCERSIDAAIDLWNSGLDGERQFERTANPQDADIKLDFKPDVNDGVEPVGGLVTWSRAIVYQDGEPTDRTTADVQVRVMKPRGGFMAFEHMRHEASHELGHVLGLEDSPRRGDIMSPLDLRHPVGKISEYELDALKNMRRMAQDVKDQALLAYAGV